MWRLLEAYVASGKLRNLGVSNMSCKKVAELMPLVTVPIAVNQVREPRGPICACLCICLYVLRSILYSLCCPSCHSVVRHLWIFAVYVFVCVCIARFSSVCLPACLIVFFADHSN